MIHAALTLWSFSYLVAFTILVIIVLIACREVIWELTKLAALIGGVVALYFFLKSWHPPKVLDDIVGYIVVFVIGAGLVALPVFAIRDTRQRMKEGMSFGAALWQTLNAKN